MTTSYRFRILNVFAEERFGGNPLCVIEDARGLSDPAMQTIARQFNLSETTFILPSSRATAAVRIFTIGYEMPFAGHPSLGTAHVVRALLGAGDAVTLEMAVGIVSVAAQGDRWTLTAPIAGAPTSWSPELPAAEMAALLGLAPDDLASPPCWVDAGVDQILVPVRTADAVRRAAPDAARFGRWPLNRRGGRTAYVFAFDAPTQPDSGVLARYFFSKQGGDISEDPGTGSACANLGGWLIRHGAARPARHQIRQGEAVSRPCSLSLDVTADDRILVGGRVVEIGRGTIEI